MRLKLLRKQKHMSQLSLAMKLNTTQMSISRYETGKREPDLKTLILIADFFDVSIDYLLERTDNPKMNNGIVKKSAVRKYPKSKIGRYQAA